MMMLNHDFDFHVVELRNADRFAEAERERLIRRARPPGPSPTLRVRCGQVLMRLGERLAGMPHTHEARPLRESEGTA